MSLVVDASVALRWYVEAPCSETAVALLGGEEPFIAPDIVVAEVTNAAWKLVRAGEIDEKHGVRIAAAIPSAFSNLVSASRLSGRAFELALDLGHPVYDCLYLALVDVTASPMVTADDRLLARLQGTDWANRVRPLAAPGRC